MRLTDVGYTACAFWRAALSLPALALLLAHPSGRAPGPRPGPGLLLLAGLFFGADLAVWHQSIRLTSVANATLMANLAPVFVTLFSFALFRERVRPAFLAGLVLAVGGAAVLVSDSLAIGADSALGDLCGMIAAVFYAGYIVAVSRARARYTTVEVMLWTTVATAALLLPIALVAGDALWPASLRGWLVLLGLALLSHVLGQGLIAYALAHLPAQFSAVGLLVQPIAAAIFAWLLLAEPFGALQALGGAVILAGIVTCRLAMQARAR